MSKFLATGNFIKETNVINSKTETYYFSRKNVKNNITHNNMKYINKIVMPLYTSADATGKIMGYFTSLNLHNLKTGNDMKIINPTIITPNGFLMATSEEYAVDNTNTPYLIESDGKQVKFHNIIASPNYNNASIVVTVLSEYNRKLTITYHA
jgi:hypothetical protein